MPPPRAPGRKNLHRPDEQGHGGDEGAHGDERDDILDKFDHLRSPYLLCSHNVLNLFQCQATPCATRAGAYRLAGRACWLESRSRGLGGMVRDRSAGCRLPISGPDATRGSQGGCRGSAAAGAPHIVGQEHRCRVPRFTRVSARPPALGASARRARRRDAAAEQREPRGRLSRRMIFVFGDSGRRKAGDGTPRALSRFAHGMRSGRRSGRHADGLAFGATVRGQDEGRAGRARPAMPDAAAERRATARRRPDVAARPRSCAAGCCAVQAA